MADAPPGWRADLAAAPDGPGWPGFACVDVANLSTQGGEAVLEAGSDVFPNDPRPVAFAVDRRFRDGSVIATATRTGSEAGVVVRRTSHRHYYAAIYRQEEAALVAGPAIGRRGQGACAHAGAGRPAARHADARVQRLGAHAPARHAGRRGRRQLHRGRDRWAPVPPGGRRSGRPDAGDHAVPERAQRGAARAGERPPAALRGAGGQRLHREPGGPVRGRRHPGPVHRELQRHPRPDRRELRADAALGRGRDHRGAG